MEFNDLGGYEEAIDASAEELARAGKDATKRITIFSEHIAYLQRTLGQLKPSSELYGVLDRTLNHYKQSFERERRIVDQMAARLVHISSLRGSVSGFEEGLETAA